MSNAGLVINIGDRFGRLVVQRIYSPRRADHFRYECRCDCGTSKVDFRGAQLRHGSNKSCGCWKRDRLGALYRTHGKSKTMQYCMFYDARKRAVALGLPFAIEPDDIVIPTICPVLGLPLTPNGARDNRPSLDRIIPGNGYVRGNIAVISFRANRIKSDSTIDEMIAILAYMGRQK